MSPSSHQITLHVDELTFRISILLRRNFKTRSCRGTDVMLIVTSSFSNSSVFSTTIGNLSTRVFETRTATGSELFSILTRLHTTAFALPSILSPLEMLGIKIWETPLSWHAKCPLPVVVRVSKTCVLKLPNETQSRRFQIPPVWRAFSKSSVPRFHDGLSECKGKA